MRHLFLLLFVLWSSCSLNFSPLSPHLWEDHKIVNLDYNALNFDVIKGENSSLDNIRFSLSLPSSGEEGSLIAWSSEPTGYINDSGEVQRPPFGTRSREIALKAVISAGGDSLEKVFDLTLPYLSVEEVHETESPGYLNVLDYGIDNTGLDPDIGPELNDLILLARNLNRDLFFPPGIYNCETDIAPFDNLTFQGSFKGLSIIRSSSRSRFIDLDDDDGDNPVHGLRISSIVFSDVEFLFDNITSRFSELTFDNCIFIRNYQPLSTDNISLIYASDVDGLVMKNNLFLMRNDPQGEFVRMFSSLKNTEMVIEENIFGMAWDNITRFASSGNEWADRMSQSYQWLVDQGFCESDMRGYEDRYLKLAHQDYESEGNHAIRDNLFLGTESGKNTAIQLNMINKIEISGNSFENPDLEIFNSRNVSFSDNRFAESSITLSVLDLTSDRTEDIYFSANTFASSPIAVIDETVIPTHFGMIYFYENSFLGIDSTLSLESDNFQTGLSLSDIAIDPFNFDSAGSLIEPLVNLISSP